MEFHRELLGEWIEDKEFEAYVDSWMAYHRAANEVDGHIKVPRTHEEYALCHLAVCRGAHAQKSFLINAGIEYKASRRNDFKWQKAKIEALRRLDK